VVTQLQVESLTVRLDGRTVVDDVSFTAKGGELVGLIGANGVGKSTLLKAIAGIQAPDAGAIRYDGELLPAKAGKARARTIAYLPQGQTVHWPIDVRQLVALGRIPHLAPLSRLSATDEAAVERAMLRADVTTFASRPATELSAGERARALLARALAVEAQVLLADEPTAALDPLHQLQVMALLRQLADDGALVIVVLHDLPLAARSCDRFLLMREGAILAEGSAETVLTGENLAAAYGVEAFFADHEGRPIVLPWREA
jgi:iron complex transport system ATP-binding protein